MEKNSAPIKYKKLEGSFGGFIKRCLVRFENENSPLHSIVHGGTGTRTIYFVRKYLKLLVLNSFNIVLNTF